MTLILSLSVIALDPYFSTKYGSLLTATIKLPKLDAYLNNSI